jgi:hypothetical protein
MHARSESTLFFLGVCTGLLLSSQIVQQMCIYFGLGLLLFVFCDGIMQKCYLHLLHGIHRVTHNECNECSCKNELTHNKQHSESVGAGATGLQRSVNSSSESVSKRNPKNDAATATLSPHKTADANLNPNNPLPTNLPQFKKANLLFPKDNARSAQRTPAKREVQFPKYAGKYATMNELDISVKYYDDTDQC